jgi:hypothetical protein
MELSSDEREVAGSHDIATLTRSRQAEAGSYTASLFEACALSAPTCPGGTKAGEAPRNTSRKQLSSRRFKVCTPDFDSPN